MSARSFTTTSRVKADGRREDVKSLRASLPAGEWLKIPSIPPNAIEWGIRNEDPTATDYIYVSFEKNPDPTLANCIYKTLPGAFAGGSEIIEEDWVPEDMWIRALTAATPYFFYYVIETENNEYEKLLQGP